MIDFGSPKTRFSGSAHPGKAWRFRAPTTAGSNPHATWLRHRRSGGQRNRASFWSTKRPGNWPAAIEIRETGNAAHMETRSSVSACSSGCPVCGVFGKPRDRIPVTDMLDHRIGMDKVKCLPLEQVRIGRIAHREREEICISAFLRFRVDDGKMQRSRFSRMKSSPISQYFSDPPRSSTWHESFSARISSISLRISMNRLARKRNSRLFLFLYGPERERGR